MRWHTMSLQPKADFDVQAPTSTATRATWHMAPAASSAGGKPAGGWTLLL